MTFGTHDTDIATCHMRDLTRDNNKNLQKKKLNLKKKEPENDIWHTVNSFLSVKNLIKVIFKNRDTIDIFFMNGYQINTILLKWVLSK